MVSALLWFGLLLAQSSSGDQSTATAFIVLVGFLIVALPTFIYTLARLLTNYRNKIIVFLFVLSALSHGFLAFHLGFFDKLRGNISQTLDAQQRPHLTQLRRAMNRQDPNASKQIAEALEAGADPNMSISDNTYMPVLVVAATRADLTTMTLLLDAGADPNRTANTRYQKMDAPSALDVVLWANVPDQQAVNGTRLLIESGASIEPSRVILGACQRGHIVFYTELLSFGAIDRPDNAGNRCLHLAVKNQHIEFVEHYLNKLKSDNGKSSVLAQANGIGQYPLDIAALTNNADLITLLLSHDAQTNKSHSQAKIDSLTGEKATN